MIRNSFLALATAGLGILSAGASAQCLAPDNLSGPCWQPTQAVLPEFPRQDLPATGVCFQQCAPQPQEDLRILVDPPVSSGCAQFLANVRILSASTGGPILTGTMSMDYTRNWSEALPVDELAVYRFVVKIELGPGADPGTPCTVPECVPALGSAFYYGYMDYAFHCSSAEVESALMLFHNCDGFIHQQALSATPGVFHPATTFALVAPHTAANPFVASLNTPPAGALVAEAVRNVLGPTGVCTYEDPIASGTLTNLIQVCGCSLSLSGKQLTARALSGSTSCVGAGGPSSFRSLKTTPNFPWFHQMTTSIGRWTSSASFPGPEIVWADEVPMAYYDACYDASGQPSTWVEIYYGASTDMGLPVIPGQGSFVTDKFLDLASNTSFSLPGSVPLPLVGAVRPTRNLIYVNTP